MSNSELDGITVLVTRPRELAEPLCKAVEAHRGRAIRWPGLEIESRIAGADVTSKLRQAGDDDVVIFVSRNAVTHGAKLLGTPLRPALAAIGPSTESALRRWGFEPDILSPGHDSEALLEHPAFADLEGRRVFIVRGVGGRELLADELGRRGAEVLYLEVYQRQSALHPPHRVEELLQLWQSGGIQMFTATSVGILDNLYHSLGEQGAHLLNRTPLVTASARVIKRAESAGHRAERLLSQAPDDNSLLNAIISWRESTSDQPAVTDNDHE